MKTPSAESLMADIRAKCLDCCAGSRKAVDACTDKSCRLHPHRHGLMKIQTGMFAADDQLPGQIDMFEKAV